MRLKLRTRIVGGLLCIFLLAIALGSFSFVSIRRTQDMSWELDVLVALDNSIKEVLEDLHIWRYELVSAIVFQTEFTNSLDVTHSAYGVWRASPNSTWIQDDVISRLIRQLDAANENMHTSTRALIADQRAGVINTAFLTLDLYEKVLPLAAESVNNLQALSNRYRELVTEQSDAVWFVQNNANMVTLIICAVAVLLFVVLSFIITRGILKPIRRLAAVAGDVAIGNLNVNLNYDIDDEIGQMTNGIKKVIETLTGLVSDLSNMARKQEDGDYEYFVDREKYMGEYRAVVEQTVGMITQRNANIMDMLDTIVKYAGGNFNAKMDPLPGKLAKINGEMNLVQNNLISVKDSVVKMINAVQSGDFSIRAEVSGYKGDWLTIVSDMNNMMEAINVPIQEIAGVMTHVSAGQLNSKVTGEFGGSFDKLKQAVNGMTSEISSYVVEISDVLGNVSNGDLTGRITRDYRGDFSEIKDTINNIIRSLNETMSGVNAVYNQVMSGVDGMSSGAETLA